MMVLNPFKVLGFTQDVFRGLSNSQIRQLVKSQVLALSTIHHPDSGGSVKKFQQIQDAVSRVTEDHEFEYWKKVFMRNRKNQIADLEKEKKQNESEIFGLRQRLIDFWIGLCREQEVFQRNLVSREGDFVYSAIGLDGFSIFKAPPVSIIMTNILTELVGRQVSRRQRQDVISLENQKKLHFCFQLSSEGVMTRQSVVKTYFDGGGRWRPTVRKEWISLHSSAPKKSYYWELKGEPEVIPGTLIGSLSRKILLIDSKKPKDDPDIAGLIPTTINQEDYQLLERGHTLDEFSPYFRYVIPRVTRSQILIIAEGNDERIRFKLLGHVIKILLSEDQEKET